MGRDGSARVHPDDRGVPAEVQLRLRVNGVLRELWLDPRVTLLDALRERLGLTVIQGPRRAATRGRAARAPCWQMAGVCCPA